METATESDAWSVASSTEAIGAAVLDVVAELRERRAAAEAQAAAIIRQAEDDAAALVRHALKVVGALARDSPESGLAAAPASLGPRPIIDLTGSAGAT
jgi:hypothetical protein